MANFKVEKVTHEKVEMSPVEMLEDARIFKEKRDYHNAELMYIKTLSLAKGTPYLTDITRKVRYALIEVYEEWAAYCVKELRFEEAEAVLNKEAKISINPWDVKNPLKMLYVAWGDRLSAVGNLKAAEQIYLKALKIEKELKPLAFLKSDILQKVIYMKYLSRRLDQQIVADRLYVSLNPGFNTKSVILLLIGIFCLYFRDYDRYGVLSFLSYLLLFLFPVFHNIFHEMQDYRMHARKQNFCLLLIKLSGIAILFASFTANELIAEKLLPLGFGLYCVILGAGRLLLFGLTGSSYIDKYIGSDK